MKTFVTRKTSRLTTPLGWLFVYLLLVQGMLPGLVLCFGSSDHIAVETPHSPVSHPTPQSQGPCVDGLFYMEKPEEQMLVVASGSPSQVLMPVLTHTAMALQWRTAPLPSDTSSRSVFASILLPTFLRPVVLRI